MLELKPRLSDEELKKLIELYNSAKASKASVSSIIRINCVIAWGKGWEWSTIEDILMVSKDIISDSIEKYKVFGVGGLVGNNYKGNNHKMTGEQ